MNIRKFAKIVYEYITECRKNVNAYRPLKISKKNPCQTGIQQGNCIAIEQTRNSTFLRTEPV